MEWNDFYKSVKDGRFESVYLFTGPEELNKKEALATLRRTILPAGLEQLNDATLENCSAQAIIDSAETLPVMCERRIVVVRDWGPLTPGKAKNEENDVARMLEWLKDVPDSCVLVFYMTVELDGRKKLAGTLKKLPGFVDFKHLSGAVLAKWCNQQLKPHGKKFHPDALNEMTMMVGEDLTRLSGEIRKLIAYTEDASEISLNDVRAVVSPSPEYSVFTILDCLLEGKLAEATRIINSVLQTEPNVVRLISLLANQLRIDTIFKYGLQAGKSDTEILSDLNSLEKPPVSSGRAYHIKKQILSIAAKDLEERYQHCVAADFDIKSGRVKDRVALDALMLKIATSPNATR